MITVVIALSMAAVEPSLKEVLSRAATYVESFERELAGLVGEEIYVQEVRGFDKRDCPKSTYAGTYQATLNCGSNLLIAMRTELRSHLLLVRNGRSGYVQYRDVYDVDGRSVGDRVERFASIFSDPSATADERKRRMLEDNSRFNIGDVIRTSNVPLLALEFLARDNQWRFSFRRGKNAIARIGDPGEVPPGTFRLSTDVWVIEYQEQEPRTMIRSIDGRDLKSRGRLWVEADTGRVMMTELITHDRDMDTSTTVSFKSEPLRGVVVPVEMRERYRTKHGGVIDAIATYDRFAPFTPERK